MYKGIIICGFSEGNSDRKISKQYLDKYGIECYTLSVSDDFAGEMVYGISVSIDECGLCVIENYENIQIKKLYDIVSMYKNGYGPIKFYIAIDGNYKLKHIEYIPEN